MPKRLAIFGGSFNPPGTHHLDMARSLLEGFDEVVIVPCGPRPDKATVGLVSAAHRGIMTEMTFGGQARVRLDMFDLTHDTFTRTHDLQARYEPEGEVWHVVGADLVIGGRDGRSFIQRTWVRGEALWHGLNFAVFLREGYQLDPADLPPRHLIVKSEASGSSTEIRERVSRGLPLDGLVVPAVAAYIGRHGLYRPVTAGNILPADQRL